LPGCPQSLPVDLLRCCTPCKNSVRIYYGKNVGNIDAFLKFVMALILFGVGLFLLNGIDGNVLGIILALCSLIPLYMVITRKCFVFKRLNISSISKKIIYFTVYNPGLTPIFFIFR